MMDFLTSHLLDVRLAAGIAALIYVVVRWSRLEFLQRMLGLQFCFVTPHTTEELRLPGGS